MLRLMLMESSAWAESRNQSSVYTGQPGHVGRDRRGAQPGELILSLPVSAFPCRSHPPERVPCVSVNGGVRESMWECVLGVRAHTRTRRIRTSWAKRNSHFLGEASIQGRKRVCPHLGSEEQSASKFQQPFARNVILPLLELQVPSSQMPQELI